MSPRESGELISNLSENVKINREAVKELAANVKHVVNTDKTMF